MVLVERSGHVDAPIERVWEVVQQADNLPAWLVGVTKAEAVSGAGQGRRQRIHTGDGSILDAEVIAWREPTLIAWRERAEGCGARSEARTETHVELAPDGDGTRVRLVVVRWPPGPISGALLRLGIRRIGAGLERSISRLGELAAVGA